MPSPHASSKHPDTGGSEASNRHPDLRRRVSIYAPQAALPTDVNSRSDASLIPLSGHAFEEAIAEGTQNAASKMYE